MQSFSAAPDPEITQSGAQPGSQPQANRRHVRARVNLGITLGQLGQPDEAAQCFEQAVQVAPDSFDARIHLARSRLSADRLDDAIHELQGFLRARYADPSGRLRRETAAFARRLAQELATRKRFADAIDVYRVVIAMDPAKPRDLYNLGSVLRSDGKTEDARQALRAALKQNPAFAPAKEALDAMTTSEDP